MHTVDDYRKPTTYYLITKQDVLDWDILSKQIERDFTDTEFRLFYNKINLYQYLRYHDISDNIFSFLLDHDKISYNDRYDLIRKENRINNDNIELICGEHSVLWAIAFENNNICENVLLENIKTLISGKGGKMIKDCIISKNAESRYQSFLLLMDLKTA